MIGGEGDTGDKKPRDRSPGEKNDQKFYFKPRRFKALRQSTLNLHTCQPIKFLRQEKEVPITENLLVSECGSPFCPRGPLRRKEIIMNSFKNETFEEWAVWKLQYIPPPRVKISSHAGFVNRFISFFWARNLSAEASKN